MRRLFLLSRIALVCNIFFLLAISLQITGWRGQEDVVSLVLLIGFLLAGIFNPVVNLLYFFIFLLRKTTSVPAWLRWINFFFLLLQIIYVLYLNDVHTRLGAV